MLFESLCKGLRKISCKRFPKAYHASRKHPKSVPVFEIQGEDDMKISHFNKHVSALALCTAFIAMPAYAQDEAASGEETSSLDEIVVTASGRD
jgi:hypothetical protein